MVRYGSNAWKSPFKDGFQRREEKLTLEIKVEIIVVNIYWAVVMCKELYIISLNTYKNLVIIPVSPRRKLELKEVK